MTPPCLDQDTIWIYVGIIMTAPVLDKDTMWIDSVKLDRDHKCYD